MPGRGVYAPSKWCPHGSASPPKTGLQWSSAGIPHRVVPCVRLQSHTVVRNGRRDDEAEEPSGAYPHDTPHFLR